MDTNSNIFKMLDQQCSSNPLPTVELPAGYTTFVCTQANLINAWEKLNQFPILFDDMIRGNFDQFVREYIDEASLILLTGDYGVCRVCNISPYRDCTIHLAFWDRRFKGRRDECRQALLYLFRILKLHRATIYIPSIAHATANFIKSLGFHKEGVIRESWLYKGTFLDLWIFGLLRSELLVEHKNEEEVDDGISRIAE